MRGAKQDQLVELFLAALAELTRSVEELRAAQRLCIAAGYVSTTESKEHP